MLRLYFFTFWMNRPFDGITLLLFYFLDEMPLVFSMITSLCMIEQREDTKYNICPSINCFQINIVAQVMCNTSAADNTKKVEKKNQISNNVEVIIITM